MFQKSNDPSRTAAGAPSGEPELHPADPTAPDTAASETVRIVAATLAFATNIDKWRTLSESWHALLSKRSYRPDSLEAIKDLQGHMASISTLIDSLDTPVSQDAINRFIQQATGAVIVMNRAMQVVAVNASGRSIFGVEQGQFSDLHWIDPGSVTKFREFVASNGGNRSLMAVRLSHPDRNRLAEVSFVLRDNDRQGLIAVRVLDLYWDESNGHFLSEAFGLTDAEIDICRLLFLGHTVEEVTEQRRATIRTVRTQLSTIFQKTETTGQVGLVLLLAQLANRAYATPPLQPRHFSDPLGREEILLRPDGMRMAVTWLGAPDGKPALFLPGGSNGYLFPAVFEEILADRGVKLIVLSRPGFGNSERHAGMDCSEDLKRSIQHLFRARALPAIPVVGLHYGAIPAIEMAATDRNPFSRVIAYGEVLRYGQLNPRNATDQARVFNWLARYAPWVNEANSKSAHRQLRHRPTEDVVRVMFSKHVFDLQFLERQDLFALLHHALNYISINGFRHEMEDETLRIRPIRRHLKTLGVPLHLLCGAVDSHHLPPRPNDAYDDEIKQMIADGRLASVHKVPGAAYFGFHQNPEFIAQTLSDLILQG